MQGPASHNVDRIEHRGTIDNDHSTSLELAPGFCIDVSRQYIDVNRQCIDVSRLLLCVIAACAALAMRSPAALFREQQ
jgi:hypothetical protein